MCNQKNGFEKLQLLSMAWTMFELSPCLVYQGIENWLIAAFFIFISYRESAARISKSIKQLPRTSAQEAADWVEYTQAQGGLQYLRPRGLDMPFYQLYFLDMLLLATLIVMTLFFVVMLLAKFIKNSVFKKKEKKN